MFIKVYTNQKFGELAYFYLGRSQRCIKLIKSDRKDISNLTNISIQVNAVLLNFTFIKES